MSGDICDWLAKEEEDAEQWGGMGGALFYREQFAAARNEIVRLRAEVERLRTEAWALAQDLFFMSAEVDKFAGENYEQYCEIKQLRAAGDALATNLERIESIYHPRCAPNIAGPARIDNCACLLALAAWKEACRG